jgi:hypothetical protein
MATPIASDVPYQASFNTAGTGQIETVKSETYVIAGAADLTVTGALTSAIINAFDVQDTDNGSTVGLNVVLPAGNKSALINALVAELMSGDQMKNYLVQFTKDTVDAILSQSGISSTIEASNIKNVVYENLATEASGGVASLVDSMAADADETLRLLATQIRVRMTGDGAYTKLPYANGDSIRMRFTVTPSVNISEDAQDVTAGAGTAGDGPTLAPTASPNYFAGVAMPARIIDLVLTKQAA